MVDWGRCLPNGGWGNCLLKVDSGIERMGREIAFQRNRFACLASSPSGENGHINIYFLDCTYRASVWAAMIDSPFHSSSSCNGW